jgi:hypothetical protein
MKTGSETASESSVQDGDQVEGEPRKVHVIPHQHRTPVMIGLVWY